MRLHWQLAMGGAVLAVGVVLLCHLYAGPGDGAGHRLTDPLFILCAALAGGGGGLAMGVVLARPLRGVVAAVRTMADGGPGAWTPPRLPPTELLELQRALGELRARQGRDTAELRGEIERLEVILDSITEGILVTDGDGRVVMANRALRDLYGLTGPLLGRRMVEAVRNAVVSDAIEDALAGRGPTSCEISEGTGTPRYLDVHTAPLPGPEGVSGTVTVFYEITRLRRLERMREDFVANVSHELRTPLTAIKGCAETLADGALGDPAAARRFVDVIANHADRLTTLLNDLLDLARLESEQTTLEPTETRVSRLVETARDAVSKVAADKGIRLEAAVPDGLAVHCDRRLIEQALINLVDNAVKYTAEGGAVRISARRLPRPRAETELDGRGWSSPTVSRTDGEEGLDAVVVEVADTGIGIPSDEVGRVFERFYRVDKGRSRVLGGTGLGLSIVRHIVELHGERVFVDTELGRGSTFGLTLRAVS